MNLKNLLIILTSMGFMILCSGGVVFADDCDGESGAAYGLCVSYCEAMDCDSEDPNADDKACENVRNAYNKITDNGSFPCDCPCYAAFMIAADGFVWSAYPGCYTHGEDGEARNTSVQGPMKLYNYYFPNDGQETDRCLGQIAGPPTFEVFYEQPLSEVTDRQAAACSAILLQLADDNDYDEC